MWATVLAINEFETTFKSQKSESELLANKVNFFFEWHILTCQKAKKWVVKELEKQGLSFTVEELLAFAKKV